MTGPPRVPLAHSTPAHTGDDVPHGKPATDSRRTVTIMLQSAEPGEEIRSRVYDSELPLSQPPYAIDELKAARPRDDQFEAVERFARDHGLEVVRRSQARHQVVAQGTVSQLEAAFGVTLEYFRHAGGMYQSHRGPVTLPAELHGVVTAVAGLDDKPCALPLGAPGAAAVETYTLSLPELGRRYNFPKNVDGTGQRIAILAFGGGYHQEDLDYYFNTILGYRTPKVTAVSVPDENGANPSNDPFPMKRLRSFIEDMSDPSLSLKQIRREMGCDICWMKALATFECTMDIEIAGAIAPGADIDVYFAAENLAGWPAAIYAAAGIRDPDDPRPRRSDNSSADHPADVISISWGSSLEANGDAWFKLLGDALKQAQGRGVAVCCASGDYGSLCVDPSESKDHLDAANLSFPASSPFVLACGGTAIRGEDEEVWNDAQWKASPRATGGGVSGFFPCPKWQSGCNVPSHASLQGKAWLHEDHRSNPAWVGRGVPDVAANADAGSGYELFVGGRQAIGGGTSAAAPLWAGLIALLAQSLAAGKARPIPLGMINMLLYRIAVMPAVRGVVGGGSNRLQGSSPDIAAFTTGPGWNPCTGLGVPDGERLLAALKAL